MPFPHADTGDKDPDPYKRKSIDEVSLEEKVTGLSNFISERKFAMMTTRDSKSGMLTSRCMGVAAKENGGIDLLFHANTESGKMADLESDPHVNISFLNNAGEWASVSGTVTVVADRVFVRKYYSPSLKAWFGDLGDGVHDGGPEDPRIAMIRVTTITATYMVVRKGMVARGMDVEKGIVTGEVAGINRLREIGREEVEGWRERWRAAQ